MNTNTKTSGSEIRELTDAELDAVNGGAVNAYCANGSHIQRSAFSFGASNPA